MNNKGDIIMKVAVITLHRVFNYGSVLQAYATQKVFQDLGYDVEIVDYITEQRTLKRIILSTSETKKPFYKKAIYLFLKSISVFIKQLTFGSFIKKYIKTTKKKYISYEDLIKNPPYADIYITGSDQVWNSKYNEGVDKGFFLEFASKDKKKIAYASSFGKSKLDEAEVEITKEYLKKYDKISVREETAVRIVNKLGYSATCLIDPTLQISKEEWLEIASKRLIKERYLILMLLYNEDNNATELARKIANEKGLKLVKICWDLKKHHLVDKMMTHRTPQNFLSLFYYADFVVTNSFHGLAFSINFEKQFIVVPRNEFNSRIESLLKITGLQNRMLSNEYQLNECKNVIDYSLVHNILSEERKRAKAFLKSCLE